MQACTYEGILDLPKLISHKPEAITTEHEITARNRLFNVDGFGMAWYTSARDDFSQADGKRPALYKNSSPPMHDANFQNICANTSSTAVFAHIRSATATAITSVNNHPFIFGRHTFMHNGVVANFIDIRREMSREIDDAAFANIKGTTDSEHLAALYITYLTKGQKDGFQKQYPVEEMKDAMAKAVRRVMELQHSILGDKAGANSLCLCATDGQQLVTVRFRNHETEQPPSLYWSETAGVTMNRKYPEHADGPHNANATLSPHEHGKHVIVASEPSTYKKEQWNLIPKNHCVIAGLDGKPSVVEVKCDPKYFAEGNDE